MPGPELRLVGPPLRPKKSIANRAYPATDIPFTATLNAQAAFSQVKARGNSKKEPRRSMVIDWSKLREFS